MPISNTFTFANKTQREEVFNAVVEVVSEMFDPDEIFSEDVLYRWAMTNGYMLVSDCAEEK